MIFVRCLPTKYILNCLFFFSFGTKRTNLFNCDIFLVSTGFEDSFVDLEVG